MLRRLSFALTLLLVVPAVALAAPAFDAFNIGASGTGTLSWTHTPSGTPKGVAVACIYASATNEITAMPTWGGVTMTQVTSSPLTKATTEVWHRPMVLFGLEYSHGRADRAGDGERRHRQEVRVLLGHGW